MKILDKLKSIIKRTELNDLAFMLNQQELKKISLEEIVRESVKKYRKQYVIILLLIILFETVMIVRGLMYFDFTKMRRVLYMVSYVTLLIFSAISLIFMIRSYKRNEVTRGNIKLVYAYCVFLTIWSTMISILDIYGGHTPIVFMTVVMGTGALAFIYPTLYILIVMPLAILILWFISKYGTGSVSSSGYPINFLVFIIFTFFIISRQFNQNKIDYIVTKKLEQLSYHDQLTGLKNRYTLHQVLENFVDVFYFGIFDFDDFKSINDSRGHDFGDSALCEVARLLEEKFDGLAFRYGGDEFVVLSTKNEDEIIKRCELINEKLREIYPDIDIQLSGGFYLSKNKNENYEDYLKLADQALRKSKAEGKSRFIFYKEEQ